MEVQFTVHLAGSMGIANLGTPIILESQAEKYVPRTEMGTNPWSNKLAFKGVKPANTGKVSWTVNDWVTLMLTA
jgi:hypothetical protein